ncbi:hypothetical protein [Actinophytocola sediminis]
MTIVSLAGMGGIGFVLVAIFVNVIYIRIGLPMPNSGQSVEEVADSLAAIGDRLRGPSVIVPVTWLCTTVFAAGLLAELWRGDLATDGWLLVGFAGVLMQNATFTVVEAFRFGMVAAAQRRDPIAGLAAAHHLLFGFNQVFLAIALLGFTTAGAGVGFNPTWHTWLGYVSAVLMFISSLSAPFTINRTNRVAVAGLIGWFGWATWIVVYSVLLLTS